MRATDLPAIGTAFAMEYSKGSRLDTPVSV
jgi:hypothetical protein